MFVHSTISYTKFASYTSYIVWHASCCICALLHKVAVYGDITESEIHNLFFGHYSFGHKGGNWSGNHVHDNVGYGFDPHDDSDNAVIAHNHVCLLYTSPSPRD